MVAGSLEVLIGAGDNPQSNGIAVKNATDDAVPVVVEAVYGITGLTVVDPPRAGAVAEWTAQTTIGEPVRVILWRQPEFNETTIGKALAAAMQQGGTA